MSTNAAPPPRGTGGTPQWDEGDKRRAVRRWFAALVAAVIVIWIVLIVWVMILAPIAKISVKPLEAGANLTVILAPVLAAAAGVERMLETIFNVIESSWKSMVAYLGRGLRWLKTAETEVIQSRQWLADVSERYKSEMSQVKLDPNLSLDKLTQTAQTQMKAADDLMAIAEKRLTEAEAGLASAATSDSYKSAKAAATIVLGLMLGVVIATLGALQMFALLGIEAIPARVDVLVTGLVIGSGSYPVHSLVGFLQRARDTLDSAHGYLDRANPNKPAATS